MSQNNRSWCLPNQITINGSCVVSPTSLLKYNHIMTAKLPIISIQDAQYTDSRYTIENMLVNSLFGHFTAPCEIICGPIFQSSGIKIDEHTFEPFIEVSVNYNITMKD